ncbi:MULTISPECIES: phospholipid-binding protein MlaC [Paraburkholderia]|jgi:ABC-type transporter MlaC component|uniref:ABC-type transporter MlaC component n=1 Tax=Paraburkholderia eburnea TaxID=1189126 RepID=A0A2S4LTF6_9BURK|nr:MULTISPECIES: ABC transporter substrate-binding protein [Paraburkholderia]MBN3855740.1 ABC transporter substrate-binding protein [Paraburkholderia sp. Ac-20340]POR45704.1 ABC-type transporter MlaC component [Paraburkholderia eburnea]PRZ14489.1 ABC-type transporter MlaC component [Paraburkholderia eburnea]HEV3428957.1 ABC transporter substrate-binding protein [Paraburkholderia sp.]
MKRYLTAFLAAAFLSGVSGAAFAQSSPDAVVKAAVEGTVKAMQADPQARGGDMAQITKVVETHFVPATDFQRTTRIAIGKAWTTATPEQQQKLYEQFQLLLVKTYASSLAQLRDTQVNFKFAPSNTGAAAKDTVVQSHVLSNGGDDAIDYRLERSGNGWKIYDINMMGAWLIQVYQTQFADQIAKGGIDGLIKFLVDHNARS